MTVEDDSKTKIYLQNTLTLLVEVFHFYKFNLKKKRKSKSTSYRENYWNSNFDIYTTIKKNILSAFDYMSQLNVQIINLDNIE